MTEALVVGAGPTGLTMACELIRRGVHARVVDDNDGPTGLSKAIGVHARTLEMLDDMGIGERLVERGVRVRGVSMYSDGRTVVEASFEELDTRHPYVLCVSQAETERVLAERLEELGGEVERGTRLAGVEQDDGGVTCALARAGGSEQRLRAAWVLGCDGAHSTVRKQLALSFEGSAYEDEFALADVTIDWELEANRIRTFFSDDGVVACFPMGGGRWRLVASVAPGELPEDRSVEPELAYFQGLMERRARAGATLGDPRWLARFRIHRRQVERYRVGRCFVAGDAAHIHSPLGGQGMNFGMHDAHNLAWKLALVARDEGRPELLDSYERERHGVAKDLLRATDVATRMATLRHPVARRVRDHMAGFMASLEVIQQRVARTVAELDLAYGDSPIVDEHRSQVWTARIGGDASASEEPTLGAWRAFDLAPRPGRRAPDGVAREEGSAQPRHLWDSIGGRRHTLLLFDGQAPTDDGYRRMAAVARRAAERCGDRLDIRVVTPAAGRPAALEWDGPVLLDPDGDLEHRYGAVAECLYVIRPDLYVGYRSQPIDEDGLMQWLNRVFT